MAVSLSGNRLAAVRMRVAVGMARAVFSPTEHSQCLFHDEERREADEDAEPARPSVRSACEGRVSVREEEEAAHAPDENVALLLDHHEVHAPGLVLAHEGVRHEVEEHV